MPDILIRDVPDDVLTAIDAKAKRVGLSRSGYLRRALERERKPARATLRGAPDQMPRARAVLDSITILTLPTPLFERAAELEPTLLRSLDAVHLAVALDLGDELDGIVTYDDRFTEAAKLPGVTVIAPT